MNIMLFVCVLLLSLSFLTPDLHPTLSLQHPIRFPQLFTWYSSDYTAIIPENFSLLFHHRFLTIFITQGTTPHCPFGKCLANVTFF